MNQMCEVCRTNEAVYEYKQNILCGDCVTKQEQQNSIYNVTDKTSFGDYSFQCSECQEQIVTAKELRAFVSDNGIEHLFCYNCEVPARFLVDESW